MKYSSSNKFIYLFYLCVSVLLLTIYSTGFVLISDIEKYVFIPFYILTSLIFFYMSFIPFYIYDLNKNNLIIYPIFRINKDIFPIKKYISIQKIKKQDFNGDYILRIDQKGQPLLLTIRKSDNVDIKIVISPKDVQACINHVNKLIENKS